MALRLKGPRRRRPWLGALTLALLAGLIAALWFALPVRSIQVTGNQVLSPTRVAQLAGARKDFGWLFYGPWRARALSRNPWVRSAKVTREWPGTVRIVVRERVPGARVVVADGREVVIALDGMVLPGATPTGPVIRGWGPDRTGEALAAARLLARYNVRSVDYTPSGLTVKTALGTAWSGSLASLHKYAAGVTMYPDKRVNIYPWGVSVQE